MKCQNRLFRRCQRHLYLHVNLIISSMMTTHTLTHTKASIEFIKVNSRSRQRRWRQQQQECDIIARNEHVSIYSSPFAQRHAVDAIYSYYLYNSFFDWRKNRYGWLDGNCEASLIDSFELTNPFYIDANVCARLIGRRTMNETNSFTKSATNFIEILLEIDSKSFLILVFSSAFSLTQQSILMDLAMEFFQWTRWKTRFFSDVVESRKWCIWSLKTNLFAFRVFFSLNV